MSTEPDTNAAIANSEDWKVAASPPQSLMEAQAGATELQNFKKAPGWEPIHLAVPGTPDYRIKALDTAVQYLRMMDSQELAAGELTEETIIQYAKRFLTFLRTGE